MQDMVNGCIADSQGLWFEQADTADDQSADGRSQPCRDLDAVKQSGQTKNKGHEQQAEQTGPDTQSEVEQQFRRMIEGEKRDVEHGFIGPEQLGDYSAGNSGDNDIGE